MNDLIERLNDAWSILTKDGDEHGVCVAIADAADALTAMQKDAERYRWLRHFYASADFEPPDHDGMDLVFAVPQGEVSADCDKTIDGLMNGANA